MRDGGELVARGGSCDESVLILRCYIKLLTNASTPHLLPAVGACSGQKKIKLFFLLFKTMITKVILLLRQVNATRAFC